MDSEIIRGAIGSAAQNVLEIMYFTAIESNISENTAENTTNDQNALDRDLAASQPGQPAEAKVIRAVLTFSGSWNGFFVSETLPQAAREIAANFTGAMDPAEVNEQTAGEVLGELTNMVCGSTLSVLGRNELFNLGSPRITFAAERVAAFAGLPSVERSFLLDSGSTIRFAITSDAFAG